ncbi:unnamed protein product [Cuscuta europaea]|uniref:Uncharacterized protein n=1 Tax=Cuscuta europaea TaxID=41803 RepID=A0A9P1E4B9_CUSEU|nr:unnamed protein product [Cuscuta europaea]
MSSRPTTLNWQEEEAEFLNEGLHAQTRSVRTEWKMNRSEYTLIKKANKMLAKPRRPRPRGGSNAGRGRRRSTDADKKHAPPNPDAPMDNSRVLATGGVGKRKKAKKNSQPQPSTVAPQGVEQPQPVQEVHPIQQVPLHQGHYEDMLIDGRFGSDQPHHFSGHFQAAQDVTMEAGQANPANVVGWIERISLEDPVHEILEKVGSLASQIWSTSAYFNNFSHPKLSIDRAEECVALTALKVPFFLLLLFFYYVIPLYFFWISVDGVV